MNEDNCVLIIRSVQIQPIRNIIVSIKDILIDATITFTKDGLRIINFDKSQTILVNVELHANKFEYYRCKPEKIIICANTVHLFKVISTMSNDDTLTIYIENSDYVDGIVSYLGLQYDNGDIKQCYSQKLRLIEPDMEELEVPDVKYSSVINMPTADFQKIIRDMNGISDRIEIKSVGSDLIFSCEGPFATCRIIRSESENMEFTSKPDPSVVIQGEFSLKSLSHFIKCTPLCSHLELYLANNLPIIVQYSSAIGVIKMCLASLP
jgi:proliferating cell nuclear antigen